MGITIIVLLPLLTVPSTHTLSLYSSNPDILYFVVCGRKKRVILVWKNMTLFKFLAECECDIPHCPRYGIPQLKWQSSTDVDVGSCHALTWWDSEWGIFMNILWDSLVLFRQTTKLYIFPVSLCLWRIWLKPLWLFIVWMNSGNFGVLCLFFSSHITIIKSYS